MDFNEMTLDLAQGKSLEEWIDEVYELRWRIEKLTGHLFDCPWHQDWHACSCGGFSSTAPPTTTSTPTSNIPLTGDME
jgi:hypothetical protein